MAAFFYRWLYTDFFVPLWPNIVASIIVGVWVELRLQVIRRLHAAHHALHMDQMDPSTPGGIADVLGEVKAARGDFAKALEMLNDLAAKRRPAGR